MLTDVNKQKIPPCACCDKASECEVWGNRLCWPCQGNWMADDQFSSGAINKSLGVSDKPEDFTTANHERYCAEAKKRTAAWVLEMRAKARAA